MTFWPVFVFVLIFVISPLPSRSQSFTIRRSRDTNFNNKDYFTVELPSSNLPTSSLCSAFGATTVSSNSRKCVCNLKNRPTFVMSNGTWQCVDDATMRASQGCQARVWDKDLHRYSSGILVIGVRASSEFFYSPKLDPDSCYDLSNAHVQAEYYGCNGTWLPQVIAGNKVSLQWYQGTNNIHLLKGELGPSFSGKLIKVSISCNTWINNGHQVKEDCLMVKVEGNRSCSARPSVITTAPVLPISTSVSVVRNGSLSETPGGGTLPTFEGDSAGVIVGAVLAVVVVLAGAVITVLVLKRKGKLWQRRPETMEEKTENPSYGTIYRQEVGCDITESENAPHSPLYAVIGKKDSKRKPREAGDSANGEVVSTSGTEYPEYARVIKTQFLQQASQSVGYDYACSEGPIGKSRPKSVASCLERCPEHGSTFNVASSEPDDSDDDDDDKGYEHLFMAKDNHACKVSESGSNKNEQQNSISEAIVEKSLEKQQDYNKFHQTCDGESSREDNGGYEVPIDCTIKEKQRALLELLASQAPSKESETANSPLTSPEYTTLIPEQALYSYIESETPDKEHVYQALIDTCDVYEPLQNAGATASSSPTQTLSLENEFDETPI